MALLRKSDGVKSLRLRPSVAPGSGASAIRPQQAPKLSPCAGVCLAGSDMRGVIALIAQREKLGLGKEEAFDKAWRHVVETNPFPATMGRICPHPCEEHCARQGKDGAVAIHAVEKFIGDWGLDRGLKLSVFPDQPKRTERVAIIGGGPAGLSCAYQLARRGYGSTIFERMPEPGGMLRYGVPSYRLPNRVLMAEIQRILDLGVVELRMNTMIGVDVTLEELRRDFASVFVAPGAGASRVISIPGVEGARVHAAREFLRAVARGTPPEIGRNVVVVGGGHTAIDVARVCVRLLGAESSVTILRVENDTMNEELLEAIEEGIRVEMLATLSSVVRDSNGRVRRAIVQRVEKGPPNGQGFASLVPLEGQTLEIDADDVVLALGQKPDVRTLLPHGGADQPGDGCLEADDNGRTQLSGVWRGGDAVNPSFASVVISQGRHAALSIAAELAHEQVEVPAKPRVVEGSRIKLDCYESLPRIERRLVPVADRMRDLLTEVEERHGEVEIVAEASRCMSCGSCYGCERCWMYCTPGCMKRLPTPAPGRYFGIKLDMCDGCKKCVDECPCGVLEAI